MANIRLANMIYWISLIVGDALVFLTFGVLLMAYDDGYDVSKGEYWSLASMTIAEKAIYVGFNGWILLNLFGLIYIGLRKYRRSKRIPLSIK